MEHQHKVRPRLVGAFSGICGIGGVQLSGRLAWEGLCGSGQFSHPQLLSYAPPEPEPGLRPKGIYTVSKGAALRAAWSLHQDHDLLLFWHLGLVKLLPVLHRRTSHTALFLHGIEAWRRLSWLERKIMRQVDLFLTNSQFTWERFLSFNPEFAKAPHQTVALGVDQPLANPPDATTVKPAVLMLSRIAKGEGYKGHEEMLRAWPLVLRQTPEAVLWIAGDGDLRPALEHLACALQVENSVVFWGRVSEAQKNELLATCRCFALPSRGEGFGLVYLEAMRLGKPCLVSLEDAAREVVNPPEAGLATALEPQALAEALGCLLQTGGEWERLSQAARLRYETQFTAKHFQQRLVEALTTLF